MNPGMSLGMSMGMSMGPSIRMEQRQELRTKLEIALEQRLLMQPRMIMELKQYLELEDVITGFIRYADEHKTWVAFNKNGFTFTYAELPYAVAKPVAEETGPGFCHCLYNSFGGRAMGDWVIFVVKDAIPAGLDSIVAIHERGHGISLNDHYFASQLEFAYARRIGKIREHVAWIDEELPSKFVDLTQQVLFPILPDELMEHLKANDKAVHDEVRCAEALIEKYPLQTEVLKRVERYGRITDAACEKIRTATGLVQNGIWDESAKAPYVKPEICADIADSILKAALQKITPEEARVVSRAQAVEALQFFKMLASEASLKTSGRNLFVPEDFKSAYLDASKGKRMVTVHYTTEDLANR